MLEQPDLREEEEEEEEHFRSPEVVELNADRRSLNGSVSLAGLDMDQFVEMIRGTVSNQGEGVRWLVADELGALYYCLANRRMRHISNMQGRRNRLISEQNADMLWERFKLYLYGNQFKVVSIGRTGRAMIFYCHRLVWRLGNGCSHILMLGPVITALNQIVTVIDTNSCCQLEPMRHVRLDGRCFKIRIQASGHKIFVRSDDVFHGSFRLGWIHSMPNDLWPAVTTNYDAAAANDDDNQLF